MSTSRETRREIPGSRGAGCFPTPIPEGRLQRFCHRIVCIRTNPGNALHAQHGGRRVREPVDSEQRVPAVFETLFCEYFFFGGRFATCGSERRLTR